MDADLALVIGIIIAVFAIPSVLSAFSDRRVPRASAVTVLIAGGVIVYAVRTHPGGYRLEQVPDVFVRVVAQFL